MLVFITNRLVYQNAVSLINKKLIKRIEVDQEARLGRDEFGALGALNWAFLRLPSRDRLARSLVINILMPRGASWILY